MARSFKFAFFIFVGSLFTTACNLNLLPGVLSEADSDDIPPSVGLALVLNSLNSASEETVAIPMQALDSNGSRFDCNSTFFTSTTTTSANNTPLDLRFYIHDFKLVDWNGGVSSAPLADGGSFQAGGAALLDFEDASGNCVTGNATFTGTTATNTSVSIAAPAGNWQGVEFTVGLPYALQRQQASAASTTAPFNVTDMYWSWTAGYKFILMEWNDAGGNRIRYHLGSTGCTAGSDGAQESCTNEYRATIRATHSDGFDPTTDTIVFNIPGLLNGFPGNNTATQCMVLQDGTNCETLVTNSGLDSSSGVSTGTGSLFTIQKGR